MNFVAHAHVALRTGESNRLRAFGAILPDIASMSGARLERSALPKSLQEGVTLHHRTDAVFHSTRAFREGSHELATRLLDLGLERGPSRAIGHAGWEMLLDGCLLDVPGVEGEFESVLDAVPAADGFPGAEHPQWHALVADMRARKWWLKYREPDVVALGLRRRLQSRPRLAFAPAQLGTVATSLTSIRPAVQASLEEVLDEVLSGVRERRLP